MEKETYYITQAILDFYKQVPVSEDLIEAISYSVKAGGKRIRPLLFLAILKGFGKEIGSVDYQVAASVEMVHTGSLIHDDLPAMDNDDYRRGQLTSHKQFDEATAILAGDSLFLDPFALLADLDLPAETRLALIKELSYASGTFGMVGGQLLDMKGEERNLSLQELQVIHANKTGQLLTFPFVAAGLILACSEEILSLLRQAGQLLGLAFQVRDDILDVTASFEELGKTPQKDLLVEKSTYPSLLGLEASKTFLSETLTQAENLFEELSTKENFDASFIQTIIERLRLDA